MQRRRSSRSGLPQIYVGQVCWWLTSRFMLVNFKFSSLSPSSTNSPFYEPNSHDHETKSSPPGMPRSIGARMTHLSPSPKPKARPSPRRWIRSKSLRGLQRRRIGVARNLSPSAPRKLRMLRPRIFSLLSREILDDQPSTSLPFA